MDLSKKIDVVEDISVDAFNRTYFTLQRPAIIKGLTRNQEAGRKWSIDYFRELTGDVVIDLYDNNNRDRSGSAYTTPDIKMKFRHYLDMLSREEPTSLRVFLFDLFKHQPQLKKDFPCPAIFRGLIDHVSHMFFGGKGTTVRMHYDIDMSNVLHTHFGGRKRVVLFEPRYSPFLYRLPLTTYSLMNPADPDYKKFPGARYVRGFDFVLEPGDTLFMPSGYWHYMTYLDNGFSVSYRRIGPGLHAPVEGLFNLMVQMPVDKLINKVMPEKWLSMKERVAEKRAGEFFLRKGLIEESIQME